MTFTKPDHIVYVVQDLAAAIDDVAARFGLRPVIGGPHPGRGTKMALLALDDRTYLEVIGPDPDQPPPERPRSFGMDALDQPKLVTWAAPAAGPDLDARVAAARAAGYDPGPVGPYARDRPDGVHLAWRMSTLRDPLPAEGLVPFLIDWGDSPHPATGAPTGCTLLDLRAAHPQPEAVRAMLRAIAVDLPVERGPQPTLIATLDTPNGRVTLR